MVTLWLTGRPCSGKTTLGKIIVERLNSSGCNSILLDGDEIRPELWPELKFSKIDRDENVRRFGYLAGMFSHQGVTPVVSVVSPYRATRDLVRQYSSQFLEIYVNAPLITCEIRDVKGMYKKAHTGEIPTFTGVTDPYEPPLCPEVECRTDLESIDQSVTKIMNAFHYKFNQLVKKQFPWSA